MVRKRGPCVSRGVGPAFQAVENLPKRDPGLRAVALGVRGQVFLELNLVGVSDARGFLNQECQLLGEPSADDRIVPVKAKRLSLASQQLLPDQRLHEGFQLLVAGISAPL